MVPVWLIYLLIGVVTYRVTRLIIEDTFPLLAIPREKFLEWLTSSDASKPAHLGALGRSTHYLLSCMWCSSMWVGAAVVYAFSLYVDTPLPIAAWLTASAIAGLIATVEDALSDD